MATWEELEVEYGEVHDPLVCGLFIEGIPLCPRCQNQGVREGQTQEKKRGQAEDRSKTPTWPAVDPRTGSSR